MYNLHYYPQMEQFDWSEMMYYKVVLATLCTELKRIQDSGYTAVDPTSPGLSICCIKVARHDAYLELCTRGMRVQGGL